MLGEVEQFWEMLGEVYDLFMQHIILSSPQSPSELVPPLLVPQVLVVHCWVECRQKLIIIFKI